MITCLLRTCCYKLKQMPRKVKTSPDKVLTSLEFCASKLTPSLSLIQNTVQLQNSKTTDVQGGKFTGRIIKYWKSLVREVVQVLSLRVFKT